MALGLMLIIYHSLPAAGALCLSVWMAWRIILVMLLKHNTNHFANPLHWALNTACCRSSQAWERQLCTCAAGSCSFVLLPSLLFLLSRAIIESHTYFVYRTNIFAKIVIDFTKSLENYLSAIFQTNWNFGTICFCYTNKQWQSCWAPNGVDVTS